MDINLFWKWRRNQKKAGCDKQPVYSSSSSSSSAPAIDPSDDSKAEASFITSTTTMDNIESRLRIVESEECEVCANQKKLLPCALQTPRGYIVEVRGAGGRAGWGEGGAEAEDLGAEGAARGGEAGDGEAVFRIQYAAAEDPIRRADLEADERDGGAAAGEGQDHLDESEEDSAAEREAQHRGEAGEGEEVLGSARRSGECGWKAVTGWSGITIAISSSLISAYNGVVPSLTS
ncbi:uncharacterized protein MONOS_12550 [Monocercomonoides exilis]|uniref:uncharacterized protein n=1 Tax=Monocercomonoides exilis TaxID=2049356 RepID=UPI00355969BC|nr:hypothetical protein MONOS_12550 [Monocercomonoides exilis]|eukprot:MONOS_12550.1-p1 / transcript=MONOS_12550.1 / gene=MONOS_12550 / organism=Monocercomonoides_exilis_PA203 / gene_product=unspecified product / transcript_product=unspecified product / location=Mono_scaffold00701:10333-11700(+) / protein_length=233 / sequence_SO=supercontig / SO=protein_coding / is_pseudo=false